MKSLKSCLILIGVSAALHAVAVPIVSNVQMQQIVGTKDVRITYDLADNFNTQLWVTVSVYPTNHVANWGTGYFPMNTMDGDARCWVTPGLGKEIIWHAGNDWNGRFTDMAKATICAVAPSNNRYCLYACPSRNLKFTTSGDACWYCSTDTSYDGNGCVYTYGSHGGLAYLSTSVNGSGTISFYYKLTTSSDQTLYLYVDGVNVWSSSSASDWTLKSYRITGSGPHTIWWQYYKTTSASLRAYVDCVNWK